METIQLDRAATVGDTVEIGGRFWTVSETVWPEHWSLWAELAPVEPETAAELAPYAFRLPSRQSAPATVYPRGVFHGAAMLETTGRAVVKKNGTAWLRCRIELWNGETRETLRGLVALR